MDREALLKKARNGVFRQLSYRDRTVNEVKEYLHRKNYPEDIKKDVVQEMLGHGYLDDHKFAVNFINYRKLSGHGMLKVRYELRQKGISRQITDQLIAENFNDQEDLTIIRKILNKREPHNKEIDRRWINRQVAFLKRRGYQDNLILDAIKDYDLSE